MIIPHHDKSRKRKKKNLTKKLSILNAYINFKLSKVSNSRTKEYPLNYWIKEKDRIVANEKIKDLITDFMTQISRNGIEKVLNQKNLKELYKKHCGNP